METKVCVPGNHSGTGTHVLLVAENGRSGGISRYCVDLRAALGDAASLACLCPDKCEGTGSCWLARRCEALGLRLVSIPMPQKAWVDGLRGLTSVWEGEGRPIIHVNGRRGNFLASLARSRHWELTFATTSHGVLGLHDRRNLAYRAVDLAASHAASAVIAVSSDTRRRLTASGVPSERIVTLTNGLASYDLDRLSALSFRRAAADRSARLRIGFLGRLSKEKGIEDFEQLIEVLCEPCPNVDFLVAGDGPSRPAFEERLAPFLKNGRVRRLGDLDDPAQLLGEIDVLVMPSHNEGLPYVLLEGMASGCVVVAYGVGGIPEALSDRSLGCLVRPGDFDGLVSVLSHLAEEPAAAAAMGSRASDHVRQRFRLASRLPGLMKAYARCDPERARLMEESYTHTKETL